MAMSRLPRRSAMRPQIGAMTALTRKVDEKTTPDQILTEAASTPNSRVRYMGRKGMSMV
ncbi:unknown [Megasphaera elsdenii CAG:570]|uniref:Uncharacterized protein n=1 Tax=Megasphaera elsdenii CAG:570 TaxID=1263087 RepID=R7MZ38_MEGEL|nr:unknown [Megasphaera elsdenii CAG:570]